MNDHILDAIIILGFIFIGIMILFYIFFALKNDIINRKLETQELQRKLAEAETEEWREKMLDKVKEKIAMTEEARDRMTRGEDLVAKYIYHQQGIEELSTELFSIYQKPINSVKKKYPDLTELDLLVICLLGIGMDHNPSQARRRIYATIGVTTNLLILCFFKYAYFFTDIFNATFGTDHHIAIQIILPVGISFYTFQNISYIVDVYRRRIAHVSNVLDFGFYTSFFPQLVAGPILRAEQFVPQLYKPFFLSRRQFGIAIFWILNGLIKKLVLSDYLAVNFVDRIFDNPSLYTPFENFSALILYSMQVYADFSGYTDIAIGVAMLMGFYLPQNFNSPYKAQNPTDFWRRWHMSLSRWLRDYLYIPLGGNRTSGFLSYFLLFLILAIAAFRLHNIGFTIAVITVCTLVLALLIFRPGHRRTLGTNVNNMDTMLLGGLWHGASFNFITWGGLNGLGILVHKWWRRQGWITHIATLVMLTAALHIATTLVDSPLLAMLRFMALVCLVGYTILHLLPQTSGGTRRAWVVWSTLLTFVFISFTRLFFRSGSNLDPAEANEIAWQTASLMVGQIGSHWDLRNR